MRNHPVAITSAKQAVDIRGIGTKQANKASQVVFIIQESTELTSYPSHIRSRRSSKREPVRVSSWSSRTPRRSPPSCSAGSSQSPVSFPNVSSPYQADSSAFLSSSGIGVTRGNQLYDLGARTLDDLRADPAKYHLTPANQIGLKFYDDLQGQSSTPFLSLFPNAVSFADWCAFCSS